MSVYLRQTTPLLRLDDEHLRVLSEHPVCHLTYTRDTWVKLVKLPSPLSFDEAMLLCQSSQDEWVAWVPEHGEVYLNRCNFYVS